MPGAVNGASAAQARRKLRERRDSRLPIPEYRIERADDETDSSLTNSSTAAGAAPAAGAAGDDDNQSDSESSSTSSTSVSRPRLSVSQRFSRSSASAANALADISITVDRNMALRASGGGSLRQKHAGPARPMITSQSMTQIAGAPSALTASAASPPPSTGASAAPSPRGTASTRFRTLPKGGAQQLADGMSKEEAMALEIESLKLMLANTQIAGDSAAAVAATVAGDDDDAHARAQPVLSTRVSMLRALVPSTVALPATVGAVCSVQVVGSTLWVGGTAGAVLAYSLPHMQLVASAQVHRSRVAAIVRVGSTRMFCSSDEGAVYVFPPKDPARAKHHVVHDAEHSAIRCLLYLEGDRPRVWSCAPARTNTQITVMNKRCEVKYKLTIMQSLCTATISPTMETCWFGCANSTVLVCDAVHGDLRREVSLPHPSSSSSSSKTKQPSVRAMLSVGDLVWCAAGPAIYVHDPFNFSCEKTLTVSPPADIESLALFENVVLAGTAAGTVECFDSISMAHIMSLPLARPHSAAPSRPSLLSRAPSSLAAQASLLYLQPLRLPVHSISGPLLLSQCE